jgi:hypothetical protein
MRGFKIAAILATTLVQAPLALAAPLPDGGVTAAEIARILQSKGFQAEIGTDKQGDPLVRSTSGGAKFGVYFYECHDQPRCESIQFSAGFTKTGVGADKVAEWNRTKRFGRAYMDSEADPWVEMDVDVEHGATTEAIANDLDRWVHVMGEFMRYIGR